MCNWFQNKSPTHTFAVDWDTRHGNWAAPCYFNGASPTGSARWGYCLERHLACKGLYSPQICGNSHGCCACATLVHMRMRRIWIVFRRPRFKMEVGARFSTLEALQTAIDAYGTSNHVLFVIHDSKTTKAANKRVQKPSELYPESLKYAYIRFVCKKFGARKSEAKGLRPNQRYTLSLHLIHSILHVSFNCGEHFNKLRPVPENSMEHVINPGFFSLVLCCPDCFGLATAHWMVFFFCFGVDWSHAGSNIWV